MEMCSANDRLGLCWLGAAAPPAARVFCLGTAECESTALHRCPQAVTDKRSRLEALRRAARGHFAVVKRLEEAGGHATLEQATEFLDAVLSGYCTGQQQQQQPHAQGQGQAQVPQQAAPTSEGGDPAAPASDGGDADGEASEDPDGGTGGASSRGAAAAGPLTVAAGAVTGSGPPGPLLYLCERAVEVVRRHPALAQEPSQRYAAALLERELSVLALVEVMVAAEAEEAARERGVAEEALKRHRAEHREAEAEYQRVQVGGVVVGCRGRWERGFPGSRWSSSCSSRRIVRMFSLTEQEAVCCGLKR